LLEKDTSGTLPEIEGAIVEIRDKLNKKTIEELIKKLHKPHLSSILREWYHSIKQGLRQLEEMSEEES